MFTVVNFNIKLQLKSCITDLIHNASRTANDIAIYSASFVDSATIVFFLDVNDITDPLKKNKNLVDFLSFKSPGKSEPL